MSLVLTASLTGVAPVNSVLRAFEIGTAGTILQSPVTVTNGSSTSPTVTFATTPTAGSLLVFEIHVRSASSANPPTVSGVSDPTNGAYTLAKGQSAGASNSLEVDHWYNAAGGNGGPDVSNSATAVSTAVNTGTTPTTVAGDVVIGSLGWIGNVALTSPTGLAVNDTQQATAVAVVSEQEGHTTGAASSTYSYSGTISSNPWCAVIVAYKPPTAGGGGWTMPLRQLLSQRNPLLRDGRPLPYAPGYRVPIWPAYGTVTNIVSAADTLAVYSDTATRTVALPRSISDTEATLTDTATRTVALPRSLADTLAVLSDTATRAAQAFTRSASDTEATLTDTATRTVAHPRTAADTEAVLSDTASRTVALPRSISDTEAVLTDTATRSAQAFTRSTSDTEAVLSDTASRTVAHPRTVADTEAVLSDTAAANRGASRTASDTLAVLADTAVRAFQAFLRTAADTEFAYTDTATVPNPVFTYRPAPANWQPWNIPGTYQVISWDFEVYQGNGLGVTPPLNTLVLCANCAYAGGTLKVWMLASQVQPLG